MIGRVVEIAEDGRRLSLNRGFMVVADGSGEIGRVPLDDIGVLVISAHGVIYTNTLLVDLANRGTAVVICGDNHRPAAWLWPIEGHHLQAARMAAQLRATRPLQKRLWQVIVRAKIDHQAAVLAVLGRPSGSLDLLARRVRSGDPDNVEAQAARRYWPLLMGSGFRRDHQAAGANSLLNFGYGVLRAATARAVVAAGLHPSVSIHHHNRANAMVLVDDLMEPFRPLVDLAVIRMVQSGSEDLRPEVKRELAAVLTWDMRTERGITPVTACLMRLAGSLATAYETGRPALELPAAPLPLDLVARSTA